MTLPQAIHLLDRAFLRLSPRRDEARGCNENLRQSLGLSASKGGDVSSGFDQILGGILGGGGQGSGGKGGSGAAMAGMAAVAAP